MDLMDSFNNKPNYFLTINNASAAVRNNHIMSISLTKNRGFNADILQITVDDSLGNIILPDRNAEIRLSLCRF